MTAPPCFELDKSKLAQMCLDAPAGTRALNALIWIALDPERLWITGQKPGPFPQDPIREPVTALIPWLLSETGEECAEALPAPDFTRLLDAAKTLVPADWGERTEIWPAHGDKPQTVSTRLFQCTEQWMTPKQLVWGHGSKDLTVEAEGSDRVLVLCAAALMAQAKEDAL